MSTENSALPGETIQGILEMMSEVTNESSSPSSFASSIKDSSHPLQQAFAAILGIEMTPCNLLFFRTMIVSFFLQPVLLYTVWFFFPSLTKNRKGLSWTLTFFSAVAMLSTWIWELGYMRTTIYSILGWDQTSGPDATLVSYLAPTLNSWILQFRSNSTNENALTAINIVTNVMSTKTSDSWIDFKDSIRQVQGQLLPLLLNIETWKDLWAIWMRWVVRLPIFSLAPLGPTQLYSANRPYFFGGGGRLFFSLEEYPRDTWFSSVMAGYFVGYCLGDMVLGMNHYSKYVGPGSGWVHHIIYIGLVLHLVPHGQLSQFMVSGAPFEVSTIFLALGNMFPDQLREDFWFPLTFFTFRIAFVILMLHEVTFNYDTPRGGAFIYLLALGVHVFWFRKYIQGRRRRTLRAQEAKTLEQEKKGTKESREWSRERQVIQDDSLANMSPSLTPTKPGTIVSEMGDDGYSTGVSSSVNGVGNTFQLRVTKTTTSTTRIASTANA